MCWVSMNKSWMSWISLIFWTKSEGKDGFPLSQLVYDRMTPGRCYSHNVELGIGYSSVGPAIDMEHDKVFRKTKNRWVLCCWDECQVKMFKDTPLLQHRRSAFDTYPDTKISISKVGGSNQPRRDGASPKGVAWRLRREFLSILLYQEVSQISKCIHK